MSQGQCPCCGVSALDRRISTDGGDYLVCSDCKSMVQAISIEAEASITAQFEEEQDRFYGENSVMLSLAFAKLQQQATNRRLKVVRQFIGKGRIVEVGPGDGSTMTLFQANGFAVDAVEHSSALANAIEKKHGVRVWCGDFSELAIDTVYDAYMSYHVIEHVPDFNAHLAKAYHVTRPGGYAFIATPHAGSLEHAVAREIAPNFSTAHLQLFSKKGLRAALSRAGWELVAIETPEYPMAWLRVVTAFLRKRKGKQDAVARGGYAAGLSGKKMKLIAIFAFLSWPLRKLQEKAQLGEELFVVARKR